MKKTLAACALVALALAGCSKTETTSTGGTPGSTAAPTTTTSAPAGPSKAEIIEKADKICVDAKKEQRDIPQPTSDAEVESYLQKIADAQKSSLKKIKDLGEPSEDADKFKDAVAKAEKVVEVFESKLSEIAKDPNLVQTDSELKEAGDEAEKAAQDFGFKECGKSSSSSSSGGSGGSGSSTTSKRSSSTTSGGSSGSGVLSLEVCLDVALANLDLVGSSSAEEAKAAGEKLAAFDPPAKVLDAIDAIVADGGPDFTNSDTPGYFDTINAWIETVCPKDR